MWERNGPRLAVPFRNIHLRCRNSERQWGKDRTAEYRLMMDCRRAGEIFRRNTNISTAHSICTDMYLRGTVACESRFAIILLRFRKSDLGSCESGKDGIAVYRLMVRDVGCRLALNRRNESSARWIRADMYLRLPL